MIIGKKAKKDLLYIDAIEHFTRENFKNIISINYTNKIVTTTDGIYKINIPEDKLKLKVKELKITIKRKEKKKIINNETELKILEEVGSRDYQAQNSRYALDMAFKKINGGSLTNDEQTKLNSIMEQNNKITSILADGRKRKKQLEIIKK